MEDTAMTNKPTDSDQQLRLHAEVMLRSNEVAIPDKLTLEEKPLLHELQVNLIELEMQNEDLHLKKEILKEKLIEREAHFNEVISMTPAGYFSLDSNECFLEVNDAWLRMYGYDSKDEIIGKHFSVVQVDSDSELAQKHLDDLHKGLPIPSGEFAGRRRDGSVGYHTFSAHPVLDDGRVVGFEWFIIDISKRKLADEELRKKNAEIEQFIYTVSHDLRSPLVTVKTFLGFLEKDMAEDNQEQLAQDIQFIHKASEKMKMLLDELLEFSRIGRIDTHPVRVSLREVMAEVLADLAGVIKERKVEIRLPVTDVILFGDRYSLLQIWQNLIENAIHFSRDDSIPCIELGLMQMSEDTVFFIKDNGIGIEPQYLKKIFGIFEKLSQKSPGAGMGLSMIQRIIEINGGKIWVESEGNGKGSCFFFTLPLMMVQS
jgi:PAS domain S-box-containing protein